tara:strand:+ start:287 stop:790 length:504 start_codon:yes stop_codon:yes gene_type:complete
MQLLTRSSVSHLAEFVIRELQKELIAQKHVDKRTLHDSLEYKVKDAGSGTHIDIFAEDYGIFVDQGRKAGTKKVPVLVLLDWVIRKGIAENDKQALSVAYAIQTKIFREGIPTVGSRKVAPRRLHWIDHTMNQIEPVIFQMLSAAVFENAQRYLDDIIERNQKKLSA